MRYSSVLPSICNLTQRFKVFFVHILRMHPSSCALILCETLHHCTGREGGTVISHSPLLMQLPLPIAMYHYLQTGKLHIGASSSIKQCMCKTLALSYSQDTISSHRQDAVFLNSSLLFSRNKLKMKRRPTEGKSRCVTQNEESLSAGLFAGGRGDRLLKHLRRC